jgi:hypothetical protein
MCRISQNSLNGTKYTDAVPKVENQWGTKREDKIKILQFAIEKFIEAKTSDNVPTEGFEQEEIDPEVTVWDLEEFDSNGYNSEEDYYE